MLLIPSATHRTKLSHAWGIAIDVNPETNAQGTPGNMDSGVVRIFRDAGFEWGGDWQGRSRDPCIFSSARDTDTTISRDTPPFNILSFRAARRRGTCFPGGPRCCRQKQVPSRRRSARNDKGVHAAAIPGVFARVVVTLRRRLFGDRFQLPQMIDVVSRTDFE
jgi:D-alanyl-D-alanine carboxypeptidase